MSFLNGSWWSVGDSTGHETSDGREMMNTIPDQAGAVLA